METHGDEKKKLLMLINVLQKINCLILLYYNMSNNQMKDFETEEFPPNCLKLNLLYTLNFVLALLVYLSAHYGILFLLYAIGTAVFILHSLY